MKKGNITKLKKLLNFSHTKPIKNKDFLEELKQLRPNEYDSLKDIIEKDIKDNIKLNLNHSQYKKRRKILENILNELTSVDKNDRAQSAEEGNTHQTNTKISLLNVIPNNDIKEISTVLLKEEQGKVSMLSKNPKSSNICLIFENLYVIDKINNKYMYDFFEKEMKFDIIYGEGKQINNKINRMYLEKYNKVYTFFDLDKEGFDFYINLKEYLETEVINYIHPKTKEKFKEIESKVKYKKINNFKEESIFDYIKKNEKNLTKEDIEVLYIMEKNGYGIEQEIFFNI